MTSEEVAAAVEFDAAGFIPGVDESITQLQQRVEKTHQIQRKFAEQLASEPEVLLFDTFAVGTRDIIAPELLEEAAGVTNELYGFEVRHVPGFYLKRGMGMFWGGCMIGDPDSGFSVFMLRDAFRKKRKFLNYQRDELLAHELCHSARQELHECMLEEYFAYRTSNSALRRYLGNCFIYDTDAWGVVISALLLPVSETVRALWMPEFPVWICWMLAAVYPLWLLCRNAWSRHWVKRAYRAVAAAGAIKPWAVLFRCTFRELRELAGCKPDRVLELVRSKSKDSLRWAVIAKRFF